MHELFVYDVCVMLADELLCCACVYVCFNKNRHANIALTNTRKDKHKD